MEIRLRYVIAIRKRGGRKGDRTLYYWHRKGHALRRLPDNPDAPEFVALVKHLNTEADGGSSEPGKIHGTVAWLHEAYTTSPEYKSLARKTQIARDNYLKRLARSCGEMPITEIDRPFILGLRDEMQATPSAANQMLECLRVVLNWAMDRQLVESNPALRPRRLKVKRRKVVWDAEAEKAFLATAREKDPAMALAYMLGAYTAQRLGDICAMTWNQYDGQSIRLTQQKTGELLTVPCHRDLRAALDTAPRKGLSVLVTPTGRPFMPSNFNVRWKAVSRAAGLPPRDYTFRDLRRTAMVRLAEAGANAIQVSAVSGHSIDSSERILERYVPRNTAMAKAAVVKLERHRK